MPTRKRRTMTNKVLSKVSGLLSTGSRKKSRQKRSQKKVKTTRRQRRSISGKILPPLDVRSDSALKKLNKLISKGPLTIMLIYADWCGHCHDIMPHWDKASQSSERSIQSVKVNEKMLPKVNSSISKMNENAAPYDVSGYPSIILVDKKGNKMTDINAVPTSLKRVMDKSASLATVNNAEIQKLESFRSQPENNVIKSVTERIVNNESAKLQSEEFEETPENSQIPSLKAYTSPMPLESVSHLYDPITVNPSIHNGYKSGPKQVNPSMPSEDMIPRQLEVPTRQKGGSLYDLMARTTYTLAPTLALLATAKAVMKKRTHKKRK